MAPCLQPVSLMHLNRESEGIKFLRLLRKPKNVGEVVQAMWERVDTVVRDPFAREEGDDERYLTLLKGLHRRGAEFSERSVTEILIACAMLGLTRCISVVAKQPFVDPNGKVGSVTPLMAAICGGNIACLKELLSHPTMDVNLVSSGDSPLSVCVKNGLSECLAHLVAHPAISLNTPVAGETVLSMAVRYGQIDCLHILLNHKNIDINARNGEAVRLALKSSNGTVLSALLNHRNVDPNIVLEDGALDGNLGCLDMILSHASLKEVRFPGFLIAAVKCKNLPLLRRLLSLPCLDVNAEAKGTTALIAAAKFGRTDCLRLLLDHPQIDIHLKSSVGDTALTTALSSGQNHCVKMLMWEVYHKHFY
eukprot:TRINITY_DN702_c0_g1_i1.p1 TRINITY_DN702_c0_g1~~TRINITY_DN702_c0_g1_i1.p1  ORF type:complete len:380 (+),score=41.69 TRINITY_DN702_c0_g1_i1:50-1141(+)